MDKQAKSKHLGLFLDAETHDKLFYIARYEGRSGSRQVIHLIHQCIRTFEQEHGKIDTEQ